LIILLLVPTVLPNNTDMVSASDYPSPNLSESGPAGILRRSQILPLYWIPPVILLVLMLLLVRLYGVNIPSSHDFDVPGHLLFRVAIGDFQWRYLWEQINDSRLVILNLICLAEACAVGWSPKHWMYGAVVLAFVEVLLAIALLRKSGVDNNLICWVFSIFAALILLHTGNAPGVFLREILAVYLFPSLFLLLGSCLYSCPIAFTRKLAIYALFALLSTFSFANGMLLWLLLFPVFSFWREVQAGAVRRKHAVIGTAFACVFGLFVILLYFRGFRRYLISGWEGWPSFIRYYCTWIGASLASRANADYSFLFGVVMLALAFVLGVLILAGAVYRRNPAQIEATWPWLLLLGYVGISGIANTFGRLQMGISNAIAPRYFSTTLLFPIGLGGLLSVIGASPTFTNRGSKICAILSLAVLLGCTIFSLVTWGSGWQKSFADFQAMKRCELALSLWRQAPDIYPLPLTLPWAKLTRFRARTHYFTLVDAGFLPDLGRDEWLVRAIEGATARPAVGEFSIEVRKGPVAVGWAMHPVTGLPFPAVVAASQEANGSLRIINVALMTNRGPLLANRSDARAGHFFLMGFSLSPLGGYDSEFRDFDRVRVFAIDPTLKEAHLLQRRER
jgi:hypothetical protein